MAMDNAYQALHRQVKHLEFRVKDTLDNPDHSSARTLQNEVRRLVDELEQCKGPRTIEDRIKHIKELLDEACHQYNSFMDVEHANEIHDAFEDLRRDVREHPHY